MNRASNGDRCTIVGRTAFSRSIIRETTATVLSDLIVTSLAAFEASLIETRVSPFRMLKRANEVYGTQCSVAMHVWCEFQIDRQQNILCAWTDVLVMDLAELFTG